jgi:N6-adenosine-specific RNA methylase IME4
MSCKVLVADPAWQFSDKLPGEGVRGAEKHYTVLSATDVARYPLPSFDKDGAVLFLWRVSSQQQEALDVVRMWGFTLKTELVWVKLSKGSPRVPLDDPEAIANAIKIHMGMGHTARGAHETCLVATRGKTKVADAGIRTTFFAPVGEHSEKPDEFFQIVEKLFPLPTDGSITHVELFSRKERSGWMCFGSELESGNVAPTPGAMITTDNPGPTPIIIENTPSPMVKDGPGGCATVGGIAAACKARGFVVSLVELTKVSKEELRTLELWCSNETCTPNWLLAQIVVARTERQEEAPPAAETKPKEKGPLTLEKKAAHIARAQAQGLISKDIPADEAWSSLLSKAPPGWFDGTSPTWAEEVKAALPDVAPAEMAPPPAGQAPTPPKRGRGRPKKTKAGETNGASNGAAQGAPPDAPEAPSNGRSPEALGWSQGVSREDIEKLRNHNGVTGNMFSQLTHLSGVLYARGYTVPITEIERMRPMELMGALAFARDEGPAPETFEKKFPRASHAYGWFAARHSLQHGTDPEDERGFWS